MKKRVYIFFAAFILVIGNQTNAQPGRSNQSVNGQQIESKVVPLEAPTVVNFTQLADYELAHPSKRVPRYIEQGEDREREIKFKPKTVPPGSPTFKVALPKPQINERVVASSPAPKISFNGVLDNGSVIPPDIEGAAGPVYLMETTNQEIDIITKTGPFKKAVSPVSFFASTGGKGFFDPHVVYDPNYGRYVICMGGNLSSGNSGFFIAVSQTNDPTGNWYEYSQDGTGNTTDLLDFPLIGYNTNWIVVTGNDFIGNNVTAKVFVFDRAGLYSGTAGTETTFLDNNAFSLSPAMTQDITQATEYLICDYDGNSGGSGFMEICTITGAVNSPAYTAVNTIGVNQPWSEKAVEPTQLGSTETLDLPDTRVGSGAFYINGSLWFCHHVFLPVTTPTHDAVDWWQIDPVAPAIQQFGRINDPTGAINYFYPALSVNTIGDALIGYCESGTNMYPSASYSFHANTDAAGVAENTYITKAGVASYYKTFGGTRNRWGDFTGTCMDAADNSFWNFNQWANTNNDWGTFISNVSPSNNNPCFTPSGLNTTGITDKSATFNWSAISNAASYNVQYRQVDSLNWTSANTTSTSYSITGLTGSTQYEWEVQTVCSDTAGTSSFTDSITFITSVTCNVALPVVTTPATICGGNSATLIATGADSLFWFDVYAGGASIGSGSPFTSPALTANTTYYVESDVYPAVQYVGPQDNTFGGGSYYTNTVTYRDLIFNCYTPVRLLSVLVYAQGAGNRTITLKDQLGNTINQTTVNIPDGSSRVPLNFDVPVGTALQLGITGNISLYRNNTGASFPYTIANVISITGTDAAGLPGYYYFFYDWEIQGQPCHSARASVNVSVNDPVAAFTFSISGDTISFEDQSSNATSWSWNFGDGSAPSSMQNPTHIYATTGNFTVSEIACNGNCCDTIYNTELIAAVIANQEDNNLVKIYPNPVKDNLSITFGTAMQNSSCVMKLTNMLGQTLLENSLSPADMAGGYTLNTSAFPKGVYMLTFQNEQHKFIKKLVKE